MILSSSQSSTRELLPFRQGSNNSDSDLVGAGLESAFEHHGIWREWVVWNRQRRGSSDKLVVDSNKKAVLALLLFQVCIAIMS